MIYLASPYNHSNPEVKLQRIETVRTISKHFMRAGSIMFSPIVYAAALDLTDFEHHQWLAFDLGIIANCSQVMVAQMDGWDKSKGVTEEIDFARSKFIPVSYLPITEIERILRKYED